MRGDECVGFHDGFWVIRMVVGGWVVVCVQVGEDVARWVWEIEMVNVEITSWWKRIVWGVKTMDM